MKYLFLHIVFLICLFSGRVALSQTLGDTTTLQHINSDDVVADSTYEKAQTEEEEEEDTNTSQADTGVLRTISESKWNKLKEDKAFIYTKEKKKETKPHTTSYHPPPLHSIGNFFNAGLFKLLMFLVVGILLFFILRHLFLNEESNLFNKRRKKLKTSDEPFENIEVFSEWELALKNALAKNDYRLAVRVLYLETLQKLHQQGLITFEQEKTNWDYVTQLSGTLHTQSFTTLTTYFDYIWYGNFLIDSEKYHTVETLYRNFQREIK